MNRISPAVTSFVAATLHFSLLHQGRAEWGGVGGYANPANGQTLNPTTSDTDGDGIPDAWENANLLKANNPADALSDFDMDGLTALQEYQLQQTTTGAFGKHLGKWTAQLLPAPTGFTSSNPSVTLIECAGNGMILANVQGILAGVSGTRTYPHIFNPETGVWTRVAAPDGVPPTVTVTALDVNSSGAVVGYYSYQGQKGFVGMFGYSGWSSTVYQLDSGTGAVNAMPLRIGDSGHVVGNVGSRRFAARPDSTEVVFPGSWSNPMFLDVNGYGEFIGTILDPLTGTSQTFLASEGHPVFLTGVRSNAVGAFAPGGPWSFIPDLDLDPVIWNEDPTGISYNVFGEAQDRQTGGWFDVLKARDGATYWKPVTQFSSSGANWYTYPGFAQVAASVNNWGEFAGNYNAITSGYYFDENGNETWLHNVSDTGHFFFDGDYHITKERPAIYGVSNDPRVLMGTPFAVWSGSLTIPVSALMPPGTPTSYGSARIADSGRIVFKAGSSLYILKPNQDTDGDGIPDDWEVFHGLNPASPVDQNGDPDGDGIGNLTEFRYRTDPSMVTVLDASGHWIHLRPGIDTDGDGLPDVWEWKHELVYNDATDGNGDADDDKLSNLQEFRLGTNPKSAHSDGDGVPDGVEVLTTFTNPLSAIDGDLDGMADDWEKWWASRILASGVTLTDPQRAALLLGNLEPNDDFLGGGTDNLNQSQVSTSIAADGSAFLIQRKERAIWGALNANQHGNACGISGLALGDVRYRGYDWSSPCPPEGWTTPSAAEIEAKLLEKAPWSSIEDWQFVLNPYTSSEMQRNITISGSESYTYTQFRNFQHLFKVILPDISPQQRKQSFVKVTTTYGYPVAGEPVINSEVINFTVAAEQTTSDATEIAPGLVNGQERRVALHPIQIKEVSFGGDDYHQLTSDDMATLYVAPQWIDVNGDGKATTNRNTGEANYPVAFKRNTKPKVGAVFKVKDLRTGESVKIKATSAQGLAIPETAVTSGEGGVVILPESTLASNNLPDSIRFHDSDDDSAFVIEWQMKVGNGEWGIIGSTKHTVCIIHDDPAPTLTSRQVTLFVVACRSATGKTTHADITEGIWGEFKGREVKRYRGSVLTYYSNYNCSNTTTSLLLQQPSGDGECTAWARFFIDTRKVHGIDDANELVQIRSNAEGFAIKNWKFSISGSSGSAEFPYLNVSPLNYVRDKDYNWDSAEVDDLIGLPGQGNDNPASLFNFHYIVFIGDNRFVDPSYGLEYNSPSNMETQVIDGYFSNEPSSVGGVPKIRKRFSKKAPAYHLFESGRTNY